MANFDLTQAKVAVDLTNPDFVNFGSFISGTPNFWDWQSVAGHRLDIVGGTFTYAAGGHANSGTVNAIGFDLNNDAFNATEITITGLNFPAVSLDNGAVGFWRILDGNDTITGPLLANMAPGAISKIFGDSIDAQAGVSTGGNDTIDAGDTQITVYGDVVNVGSQAVGAPPVIYTGGDDQISGRDTASRQTLVGDAERVHASGRLNGGDDIINVRSTAILPEASGDVLGVAGVAGNIAELFGGDDVLDATGMLAASFDFGVSMYGDAGNSGTFSSVTGGADVLLGSFWNDNLTGDVGNNGGTVIGGADEFYGNGGDDNIVGEVFNASGTIFGGNDLMYGGDGADRMFGEYANGTNIVLIGGNDRMYGGAGADFMRGQSGNDLLDGGTGADAMEGGTGNDRYYVDNIGDVTDETGGNGTDFVYSSVSYTAAAGIERLYLQGTANINATGSDGQVDYLVGNIGNNVLDGKSGVDTAIGGLGNDTYIISAATDNIIETVGGGTADRAKASVSFALATGDNIEFLETTSSALAGAINLTGNEIAQTITGNAGANVLKGGGGKDVLNGLSGYDTADFSDKTLAVVATLNGAVATNVTVGGVVEDSIRNIENLTGGKALDTLTGNATANILNGGVDALADNLRGGLGNDTYIINSATDNITELVGGGTADRAKASVSFTLAAGDNIEFLETTNAAGTGALGLTGNEIAQTIIGNAGANVINGARGNDVLTGGLGQDSFLFNTTLNAATNRDVITDFNVVADRIMLENTVFTGVGPNGSVLNAALFKNLTTGGPVDANDRILYNDVTGAIFYDSDGSGGAAAIQFATFTGAPTVTNADFFVV